jgi:tetrahydromethanopterin S-methyltransferase subunit G
MMAQSLEARIAHVEGAFDQVNERLGSIDRRLDGIDTRFNWLTGIVIGTWATTILTILFHR